MPFGLTIGTERAISLQNAIQDELMKRGFSPDTDPVMAEYITIMIINNKTGAQITSELEDLIGSDFDPSFTDWLFAEAAKGIPESEIPSTTSPSTSPSLPSTALPKPQPPSEISTQPSSSSSTDQKRPPNAPRAAAPGGVPLYQQALSSTLGSSHGHGQKRTASVRSPSPTGHGPSKTRRMDVPTGPRAMQSGVTRGGEGGAGGSGSGRSLLDRVGGRNGGLISYTRGDEIQARIDAVTNGGLPSGGAGPDPSMMLGFQNGVGMGPGIDMGAANVNPSTIMLQEMMMNQMALMAQMATSMGMLNPATGQIMGGFPGMPQGDIGIYPGGGPGDAFGQGQGQGQGVNGRGRGSGRGGRGRGGLGRGGHFGSSPASPSETTTPTQTQVQVQPEPSAPQSSGASTPIAAPTPTPAIMSQPLPAQPQRIPYAVPERPQSPTLCKFGTKCQNSQCRFSHPSPVATAESGVVLSTEACENGKDCKDKDCIKSHVSPAVHGPGAELQKPPSMHPHPHAAASHTHTPSHTIPCRFGASCTRPNCPYTHPSRPSTHFNQQCRFGAACTRAMCPFQHPDGRVLPTSFHRGLSTSAPMVNVPTPETGSIGAAGSVHRSVTFNAPSKGAGAGAVGNVKDQLEKQIKELEATKKAVQMAEAAAAGKKDEAKPAVPIVA
ncbi:hypothetical protein BS17DRAFT_799715 [Gyrodon lividus]|nr:hypothetical protein BS17DRAFT_799715 [Gyrodon lividus]